LVGKLLKNRGFLSSTSYACLCHINENFIDAERHFEEALKLGMRPSTYCDYGLLLVRQNKRFLAIEKLLGAVLRNNDDSGLTYGMLESKLLDKYLRQECTKESSLTVKPYFIAHYWLFQCFHLLKNAELATFCIAQLSKLCEKLPSALHYRILGYAYTIAGKNDKADECKKLSSSHTLPTLMTDVHRKDIVKLLNHQQTYLSHIQELAEHAPTALRLNTLICIYRLLNMEDRIVEVEAQALSLDIDLQMTVSNNTSSNTTQLRLGELTYNPTLFNNAQQTQKPAASQTTSAVAPASKKDESKGPQKTAS
jgi:hypothetical protein